MATEDFTIGVEEEFQLVDPSTRALQPDVEGVLPTARSMTSPAEVSHELQQTQIEIGTPICTSLDEVRAELLRLRATVDAAARTRGLRIVAAGAHPTAGREDHRITVHGEYLDLARHYAFLAHEQVVFGCHVHVGVADREVAIGAMNHVRPWLPALLALSVSSPFWNGVDTGYASYRSEVFGRWPTAGIPEPFASRAEFDDVVGQLLFTGAIDDRARIYWDVRPSARYETLEVRIADVCTSVDDAVLTAGVAGALVRRGAALHAAGEAPPTIRPEVLRAARWRAGRYGLDESLIDVVGGELAPADAVVARLLEHIAPALDEWGERAQVTELVQRVLARGTSAHRQRIVFERERSMDDVVDWLIDETSAT